MEQVIKLQDRGQEQSQECCKEGATHLDVLVSHGLSPGGRSSFEHRVAIFPEHELVKTAQRLGPKRKGEVAIGTWARIDLYKHVGHS